MSKRPPDMEGSWAGSWQWVILQLGSCAGLITSRCKKRLAYYETWTA